MKIAPQRGAIPITLDRPRTLFFDMAATWVLVSKYGRRFIGDLYTVVRNQDNPKDFKLELKSLEALKFFLWVGLQAEISDTDEGLTEEQAADFIRPWTFEPIFNAVVMAITGATVTPAAPGKESGAAAAAKPSPRPVASRRGSTTTRRSGSVAES